MCGCRGAGSAEANILHSASRCKKLPGVPGSGEVILRERQRIVTAVERARTRGALGGLLVAGFAMHIILFSVDGNV